jgi:hypothetical protein
VQNDAVVPVVEAVVQPAVVSAAKPATKPAQVARTSRHNADDYADSAGFGDHLPAFMRGK